MCVRGCSLYFNPFAIRPAVRCPPIVHTFKLSVYTYHICQGDMSFVHLYLKISSNLNCVIIAVEFCLGRKVGRYLHCYSRRSIVYIYHKIWIIEIKFIIIIFKMLMYNTNVKLSYYYEVSIKNEFFFSSVHFKVVELPSYISKK